MDVRSLIEYGSAFLTLYFAVFLFVVYLQHRDEMTRNPRPPKRLPRLTIVIPAYNEEKTIAKTIESALAADYPASKKEILVVDDGSTDHTLGIASSFRRRGVKVLHKRNGGKASAMNLALTKASGEYIATLDSDSYMEKDSILKMMGYFKEDGVVAVTSVMKVWKRDSLWQRLQGVEYVAAAFTRRLLAFLEGINVTPGPLSIFKASIFKRIGNFDEHNLLEDQEFALRIQKNNYRIKSSTNAVVYTDVPGEFWSLLHQRVRWYRGGMRNFLAYYKLVSPKYGDFGIFLMPLTILSIFVLAAFMIVMVLALLSGTNFLAYLQYGFTGILLGLKPLQFITLAILIVVGVYSYVSLRYLDNEFINVPVLLAYILFYTPVILVFWAVSFLHEVRFARLRW